MSIGKRLKQARKHRHMTQKILASQVGVSRSTITNIEIDRLDTPQPVVINMICNVLAINKDWLLDGVGSMERESDISNNILNSGTYTNLLKAMELLSDNERGFLYEVISLYVKHFK